MPSSNRASGSEQRSLWVSELGKLGIPCAPIQTLDEVAAEPQFDHRLIFTEIPNPQTPDASVKVVSAGHVSEPAPPKCNALTEPRPRQRQRARRTGL
ncbi:MAG: hypothetical protein CM15mP120_02830 [Pseudomonadota bacterium]|nr:MAG: hypothetical protein CM15mP120_02830 [Pseudomonadota bacterium]